MFPCEMARYIAGFSRKARKSGLFCRLRSPLVESADSVRCTKLWPGKDCKRAKPAESARRVLSCFRCTQRERENLLQRGVDVPELGAEIATDTVDRRDDSQRDTRC